MKVVITSTHVMVSTSDCFRWGTMKEEDTATHGMPGGKQEQHTGTSEIQDTHGDPGHVSRTDADATAVGRGEDTQDTGRKMTPQQEIQEFINSKEAGMISAFTKPQLWRAAEALYTANGLNCPVRIEYINGETVLINREIYGTSH